MKRGNKIESTVNDLDIRVDQEKKPYIRVNTRELNRELCTK